MTSPFIRENDQVQTRNPLLMNEEEARKVFIAEGDSIGRKSGKRDRGKKEWISARYSFAILAFFGFVNLYALRVNLSVAIVAMVRNVELPPGTAPVEGTCPIYNTSGNSTKEEHGEFIWDTQTQGILLGSFFYGYIFTQLPGAWVAKRFGAKQPFGLSAFFAGVLALFIPVAARWHYGALIAVRFLQGVFEGVCFPSAHTLLSKWCPPMERTRIVSIVYSGMHVGTVGTLLLSGILADYLGWESIFYFFGACAILWYIIWTVFAHESPDSHPRISGAERDYIVTSIGQNSNQSNNSTIPWKKMLLSLPVWAIAVGHFGNNWGFYTLLTNLPTFLSNVLHFKLKENGGWSAVPYLAMAAIMPISGYVADNLRRRQILTTTNVRRIFHFLGVCLPAVCLVALGYVGCDVTLAMVLLTLGVGLAGLASAAGFQVNHIDISPTFGGILMGLTNTLGTVPGIVGPYVAGMITTDQTTAQWQMVFFISAGIYVTTGIFYAIFCSGEPESWEKKKVDKSVDDDTAM